jgi:hypothetical protein
MSPGHGFRVRGTRNLFTSDEAIQRALTPGLDCFATLATTERVPLIR